MPAKVPVDAQILNFAKANEIVTGEDANVTLAHWMSEEPIDSLASWQNVGNNPAGIRPGNKEVDALSVGVSDQGFDVFPTPLRGFQAYTLLIRGDRNYQGVRDAIKTKDPQQELEAIAASPWDAGHYGGDGKNLFNAYNAITGGGLAPKGPDANPIGIDTSTPEGQKLMDQTKADTNKKIGAFIRDQLGLTTNAWELGIVVLGSVGILVVLLMLFRGKA